MFSMGIMQAQLAMGIMAFLCIAFASISMLRQKKAREKAKLLNKKNQAKK